MKEHRIFELFSKNKINIDFSVSNCPPRLLRQERDWTCAFACIRTIMSAFDAGWINETDIIKRYKLTPGPYFSYDLKKLGIINHMDVVYGCDNPFVSFDDIIRYMKSGYYVMLESLTNYSHWMVLLGCYVLGDATDAESIKLSFYDPYYNDIKFVLLDEFINIWIDAEKEDNGIEKDFLAIKKP